MGSSFFIFGYGSLIFSPEQPERVKSRTLGRLADHRRSFNKRSSTRRCRKERSFDAFGGVAPSFLREGFHHSLVLGTEAADGESIMGVLLEYPESCRGEVLALTDRREGYSEAHQPAQNGYLRVEMNVKLMAGPHTVNAVTYVSNPSPDAEWSAPDWMTAEDRARVLINATPRHPIRAEERLGGPGLYYLEGVRSDLRRLGILDPHLERLAEVVRQLDGPWQRLVHPVSD